MKRRALSHDGLRHHGDVGYWSKRSLLGLLDCLLEQVVKTPINAGTSKADLQHAEESSVGIWRQAVIHDLDALSAGVEVSPPVKSRQSL